jgi:hypothetical protein
LCSISPAVDIWGHVQILVGLGITALKVYLVKALPNYQKQVTFATPLKFLFLKEKWWELGGFSLEAECMFSKWEAMGSIPTA